MKIRVGGIYLNGYGEEVKIEGFNEWNANYPYIGILGREYTPSGGCMIKYAEYGSRYNLVEEVTPQAIDFIISEE